MYAWELLEDRVAAESLRPLNVVRVYISLTTLTLKS